VNLELTEQTAAWQVSNSIIFHSVNMIRS